MEDEKKVKISRVERDELREAVRISAQNAAYYRKKRLELLAWVHEICTSRECLAPIVPQKFKDDFYLLRSHKKSSSDRF